ncbi:flagellar hook-basal body complex protein FliE [Aquincola sp. J276]|uniref:flagellar hook-basal body complex protein FliE n=1 Tax=Aquincola sp. J276 TaxID=2898432 RepID=UPI002150A79C|nr:flagellar hook-basal body complex protein FliE [Aquincola sp. J276]MCR5869214.1 flagellar hook-basal body complex protein FliE [Aquincola sp. J276]
MSSALLSIQADLARIAGDVERLAPAAPVQPAAPVDDGFDAASASQGDGFVAGFKQVLQAVDERDKAASAQVADVDAGRSDDLVGAMLASQQASLSFSMLMQVRNKVVGAFDELIKLQL